MLFSNMLLAKSLPPRPKANPPAKDNIATNPTKIMNKKLDAIFN
ncbi:MAG: hypothetical protein PHO23_01470 [Candidatus Pacebacteria bacterium]|nr:hypothetical protein [Candidatus Paceibacterota bacterium]